ncbi:MAG: periplasmic heavy metal sensor [Deltaproteobacteria bacterium]|nr:periplasmic heavy metal sensor [Deltaproteobacteria bacterium]
MKKWVTVLGVFLLVGVMTYPVFARGPGWGYGSGGLGYCRQDQRGYPAVFPEQQQNLNRLDQNFVNETSATRNNIWNKQNEMTVLLNGENPDLTQLRTLQKEISGLKAQMAEKRLAYRLETRKVAPEGTYGGGYGRGRGGNRGNWGGRCWS